jgi:hypothetical protein
VDRDYAGCAVLHRGGGGSMESGGTSERGVFVVERVWSHGGVVRRGADCDAHTDDAVDRETEDLEGTRSVADGGRERHGVAQGAWLEAAAEIRAEVSVRGRETDEAMPCGCRKLGVVPFRRV